MAVPGVIHKVALNKLKISNGQWIDLSTIPGDGWTRERVELVRQALLAITDYRVARADLPDDEPTKTRTQAQLDTQYGGMLFIEGDDLVDRQVDYNIRVKGDRLEIETYRIPWKRSD